MKRIFTTAIMLLTSTLLAMENDNQKWDKTFPKSDTVCSRKVNFKNRFGIKLVGDLYLPKDFSGKKLPAIAVCGPFGAVKEQSSGLYAQQLAKMGYAALAFDASFTGESGPEGCANVASADINTEDFCAAVDFLSNQEFADPDKIGILGICGFGGFAINAAAIDTRIRAAVASTMYDMTRVSARGYFDSIDENARWQLKDKLCKQRTADFASGRPAPAEGLPEKLSGSEPQFVKDYYMYYKTPRGFHSRSINSNGHWNATSALSLINMPILSYASEIRSAVLVVHGEKAHSRYFGEDAFAKLKGDNKHLIIVEGASHVDLYDNMQKIPFDKIDEFFKKYLHVD